MSNDVLNHGTQIRSLHGEQITDLLFHLELMSFSGWKCRLSQSELVENLAT